MQEGLLLLSGGIDSPVAGHVLQSQGCPLQAVHFSQEPWTDDEPERKSRAAAAVLGIDELTVVPMDRAAAAMAKADHRSYFVLTKRFMAAAASRLAEEEGWSLLVTGESVGQVSSQTLQNLAVIDGAAHLPVVRPLLGWDKMEIVAYAETIGTYEFSVGPEHCDALGPEHPATAAGLDDVEGIEADLDLDALVADALGRRRTVQTAPP